MACVFDSLNILDMHVYRKVRLQCIWIQELKQELQEATMNKHCVSLKGNSTMQLEEDIPLHVYLKTIQSYYWVKLTVCVIAQHCFLLCKLSSFSLE